MWESLRQTDIEQAKQHLKRRRGETLERHAEEVDGLDAEQTDLATLNRLATVFAQKLKQSTLSPPAPRASSGSHTKPGDRAPHAIRPRDQGNYPETNFQAFSRALSRG